MDAKPDNITLTAEFYRNNEDHSNKRGKFIQAWRSIRRVDGNQLGR
ncbi:hypothetical protein A2U01_0108412, partial [Trifolium medium]|nr:hypothetical protein [Trifolium medium]